ncbi:RecB family exonuclease, partial [Nakamurella endophytica]|uniref:RecB family exonuclease n=1 Tax=Nakamurella endophytica TaxID=1748367 RepID=UPI001E42BFB4
GGRRTAVEDGADLVRAALRRRAAGADPAPTGSGADAADERGWTRDVALLLAERERARSTEVDLTLPAGLSVSALVDLAADPRSLARRLRRPVPAPPSEHARRGTAFHAWLERRYAGAPLLDVADLPGAADEGVAAEPGLQELRDAFLRSPWADRQPTHIELPFTTAVAGLTVRGRMDAVFADPDGGVTVVDWKTGPPPSGADLDVAAVQLATYRLAAAALLGLPLDRVRAAFVHVRAGVTISPADLLDADGLADLVHRSVAGPGDDPPASATASRRAGRHGPGRGRGAGPQRQAGGTPDGHDPGPSGPPAAILADVDADEPVPLPDEPPESDDPYGLFDLPDDGPSRKDGAAVAPSTS